MSRLRLLRLSPDAAVVIVLSHPQALFNMQQLEPTLLREILSTDADTGGESDGAGDARSRFEAMFGRKWMISARSRRFITSNIM